VKRIIVGHTIVPAYGIPGDAQFGIDLYAVDKNGDYITYLHLY